MQSSKNFVQHGQLIMREMVEGIASQKADKGVRQINGHIPHEVNQLLMSYAEKLGLGKTGLANMLVVRALVRPDDVQFLPACKTGGKSKVTVRLPSEADHERFLDLARRCQRPASQLISSLVAAELRHRTLETWLNEPVLTQLESQSALLR